MVAVRPGAAPARREPKRDRSEENHAAVTELLESIRKQLEIQGQRMERMGHSLEQLGVILERLPEASQTQNEVLSAIKQLAESAVTGAARAEERLSQIPRIADAQRETMVSIGRQLDLLRESGDREMEALSGLEQAVSRLAETAGASTAALKELHDDSLARDRHLREGIEKQTKRLTLFSALAVSIAAIAIVLGLVALFR
jgi:hypothetical protein